MFDGNYVPGDVIGFGCYEHRAIGLQQGLRHLRERQLGALLLALLNAGMQILGGLSAIYTLGSGSIGLETKKGEYPASYSSNN